MYTKYQAADYRKFIELPDDYHVDGLLAHGIWDLRAEEKALPYLKEALDSQNIKYRVIGNNVLVF